MLVLALVSDMMTRTFGAEWANSGTLKIRWRAPAFPPIVVTARAVLRSTRDGVATYQVTCETDDAILMTGVATVAYV